MRVRTTMAGVCCVALAIDLCVCAAAANGQEPTVIMLPPPISADAQLRVAGGASSSRAAATTSDPAAMERRLQQLEAQNAALAHDYEQLRAKLNMTPNDESAGRSQMAGYRAVAAEPTVSAASGQAQQEAAIGELDAGMKQLQGGVQELGSGMKQLQGGVQELAKHLTVTTVDSSNGFKVAVFGALSTEMILADTRPLIPSAVASVSPDFGRDTSIATISARSSYLGAAVVGPKICDMDSGGVVLAYFYSETILNDAYGFFLARAYGELKDDDVRYSAGVDGDVINPLNMDMVDWSVGCGAGNIGFLRAQVRVEHYYYLDCDYSQITTQFALSNPFPTNYEDFSLKEGLTESNGWPNVEGRIAYGWGCLVKNGMETMRPSEVGLSGLIGELRQTGNILTPNSVATVWAVGTDARLAFTDRCGVKGEFYTGQTVGTYLGAAIQNFNANHEGIHSTGGWGELYYDYTPCVHFHAGYGVDNPMNSDLTAGEISRNQVYFGNVMWDITKSLEVGFEVSHWDTDYVAPLRDNQANVFDTRVQLKF